MNPVPKHKLAATYHQTPSLGQELIPSEVQVLTSSHRGSGLPRFIQVGHKTMQSPKPIWPFQAIIKCGTSAAHAGWHRGTGTLLLHAGCWEAHLWCWLKHLRALVLCAGSHPKDHSVEMQAAQRPVWFWHVYRLLPELMNPAGTEIHFRGRGLALSFQNIL